ncbi:hypothetical protein CHT98_02285 [Azospirillum brasilense]|uniref:Uncharacterized protein n=1 Tax=Azospirillum brasilense TaxID=192 RepID=A0A235HKN3_AZOBR|nr:hypothetical protein CHT98_02285 [Azospirillum brasilense]
MAFATIAGVEEVPRRAWCGAERRAFPAMERRRSATPDGDAGRVASSGVPMTGDHLRSGTSIA